MALKWILLFVMSTTTSALDNGLALTPPMGWMTWERFRCTTDCKKYPKECISEDLIRRMAETMSADHWMDAGYEYIIIDDCWLEKKRGPDGRIVPNKERFPNGIRELVIYVHALGLKFGIYEDYGNMTCAGYPGVLNHEQTDVDTFVEWGVDYIKLDGCYNDVTQFETGYLDFGKKLNDSGRPILYSCSWPDYQEEASILPNYTVVAKHCNIWRNWDDIQDSWASLTGIMNWFGDNQERFAQHAGPGQWNDPDMLIIGNYGLSEDQAKVQMAVWSIMAAPLIMSVDLDTIKQEFKEILLNRDIIAINQDPLAKQGLRVWQNKKYKSKLTRKEKQNLDRHQRAGLEIWKRDLSHGCYAVAFVSQRDDGSPYTAKFSFQEMDVPEQEYDVVDLYMVPSLRHERTLKPGEEFEVRVNPTGVQFYKFIPKPQEALKNYPQVVKL